MHPLRVTVWCGLWSGGIIGPYFFEDEGGATVTVNGDTYRTMITDFFVPALDGIDVDNVWFQQDGATCHISCHNRLIAQNVRWPFYQPKW